MAKADNERSGVARRDPVKKGTTGSPAAWSSPVVQSLEAGSEAASSR